MLTELAIENFAIIDRLLLRLNPGFTVLTGETGAGKSIIIDALQAALGARVASDVVRGDAAAASVEAIFELEPDEKSALANVLAEYGVDEGDPLILRRDIAAGGRATARLNGRAVPASVLGALGSALVDIHGQSEHLSILRRDRQLDVLDRFGGLLDLRAVVAAAVRELGRLQKDLDELLSGQRDAAQRLDILRFQVEEIFGAEIRPGEDDELGLERNLLTNAEKLSQLSARAYDLLQVNSASVAENLALASGAMRELAAIDPSLSELSARVEAALYELEDIAQETRHYRDSIEYDPRRIEAIEERLDLLGRLRRKYGPALEDVVAFGEQAREELDIVENFDDRVSELEANVREAERLAATHALQLSQAREQAARDLTVAMENALQGLGLNGTRFAAEMARTDSVDGLEIPGEGRFAFNATGIDSLAFLVSFNVGEPLRPLERVASGGETSRFLLALKSVLSEADRTPTLIFDEVDVGVGGRRAGDVGARMRALSGTHQVVSITHLPQIAALAEQHLRVEKAMRDNRTTVDVRELQGGERVAELAEMMSGSGSEAARKNAQELLESARRSG